MIHEKVKVLGQLLGCYFHQDWPEEFDSEASVLQAIVESEPKEQLQVGAKEIDVLLASHLSEDELKEVLIDTVGCYFEPSSKGVTYEQWLMGVREKFAQ